MPAPSTSPAPRRERVLVGVGLVALAVVFFGHLARWPFLCDDAYISFRYAVNLSRHGALAYNLNPVEYVEGYTNFAWVLALAGLDRVGIVPERAAPVLTAAASLVSLLLAVELLVALRARFALGTVPGTMPGTAADAGGRPPITLLALGPALWLVLLPEFVVWGSGGLETSAAAALALGAMLAWTRDRHELAAGLATAAGLVRFDALLPIAAFGLGWIGAALARARGAGARIDLRALPWAALARALAIFALPLLAHFLFRRAYYGAWWPNTWAIKQHGALLRASFGAPYLRAWAAALHLVWLAPLALMLRLRHLPVALPVALGVLYAWAVGGDFMAYGRFLLVPTTLVAVLAWWLAADVDAILAPRLARPLPLVQGAAAAFALVLAAGLPARIELDRAAPWIDGRWEGVSGMDRFARERVAAGAWFGARLPPETLVSVGAAGAMPYAAGVQVLDVYGLVDPELARAVAPRTGSGARPGHQIEAPAAYIEARDPDLLCHIGYVGTRQPRWVDALRRGARKHRWLCAPVGEIEDPYGADGRREVGHYCCLQPLDRAELR